MNRKQQIVSRITELERANETNAAEIEALKRELVETPDALLERDPEADTLAAVQRKNDFLRKQGLL
jgi:hypothetical protein